MADKNAEAKREAPTFGGGNRSSSKGLNGDNLSPSYLAAVFSVPAPVLLPETSESLQEHSHSKLRRFFDHFVLIELLKEPLAYSRKTKWLITFLVSGAAAVDPISSSIVYRTQFAPFL